MPKVHETPWEMIAQHRYWAAFNYPTDQAAKTAWEDAEKHSFNVSVWRFKAPQEPPYRDFIVVVLGEDRDRVKVIESRLRKHQGVRVWEPPEGMLDGLVKRRLRQAFDNVRATGKVGGKSIVRTPSGRVLHPDGTMEPFKKPQG